MTPTAAPIFFDNSVMLVTAAIVSSTTLMLATASDLAAAILSCV